MTHPHHAPVRELFVSAEAASALRAEAARLPGWTLDPQQAGELALLLNGGFAPLRGYMTEADFAAAAVVGAVAPWPVPLALRVDADFAARVAPGDDIALRDAAGQALAVMSVTDRWGDPAFLGGKVKGLHRAGGVTPNDTRAALRDRAAVRVLAVQPRHREEIAPAVAVARAIDAALLVQPWPGVTVAAPADALVAPLPAAPPPGPRAALWAALVARNHGATHVVAPGDPAARALLRHHAGHVGISVAIPGPMA